MHRITRHFLVLSAVIAILSAGTIAPAAATHNSDSPWDDLGETVCDPTDEDVSTFDCIAAANSGILSITERAAYAASSAASISEDGSQAETHATKLQETYNANNATLEAWLNPRFNGTVADYDTIELRFEDNGANATRYLVAETDAADNVTNSTVINSTDRSVDHTVSFSGFAAADADSELRRFVDEYAAADRNIDPALVSRLGNRYAGGTDVPEGLQP